MASINPTYHIINCQWFTLSCFCRHKSDERDCDLKEEIMSNTVDLMEYVNDSSLLGVNTTQTIVCCKIGRGKLSWFTKRF